MSAALCYGAAWILAFVVLGVVARCYVPDAVWRAMPKQEPGLWLSGALPTAAGSLVLTMLAQTGVIILELNHPDEAVVSAYAVAFQTGTFVIILATATNRLYAPQISELLDRGDIQTLRKMGRNRLLLIAPLTIVYLFVISTFGRAILSLFGAQYATEYAALGLDRPRCLDQHALLAGPTLCAFHRSRSCRARGAGGSSLPEPGAVHPAQSLLRGARRGLRLCGPGHAPSCRLVAVRARRHGAAQAGQTAQRSRGPSRDSC